MEKKFDKAAFEAAKNRATKPATPSTLSLTPMEGSNSKIRQEAAEKRALKRN